MNAPTQQPTITVGGFSIDILVQGFPGKTVCHGGLGWSTVALLRGEGRIVRWRLSDGSVLDDWSLPSGSFAHPMSDGRHIVVTTPNGPAYIVRLGRWLGVRN